MSTSQMTMSRRRLASATGLGLVVSLIAVASAAAGPVNAEGEPLHVSPGAPVTVAVTAESATATTQLSRTSRAVPLSTPGTPEPRSFPAKASPWPAPPALAGALAAVLTLGALTFGARSHRSERKEP